MIVIFDSISCFCMFLVRNTFLIIRSWFLCVRGSLLLDYVGRSKNLMRFKNCVVVYFIRNICFTFLSVLAKYILLCRTWTFIFLIELIIFKYVHFYKKLKNKVTRQYKFNITIYDNYLLVENFNIFMSDIFQWN